MEKKNETRKTKSRMQKKARKKKKNLKQVGKIIQSPNLSQIQ